MPTCALYARVSSEQQAEKDLSIPAQLHELRAYAQKNGLQIYREFVDEALSGRSDDRAAFQEMIALARRKPPPFTAILIHKLDRFSRNREHAVTYKAILRRQGIKLISLSEPLGDSPYDRLMEGMLEVIAEFYSLNLGQETRKGLKQVARLGYFTGGRPPYGYRLATVEGPNGQKKHILEPDPETTPTVTRIFDSYGNRGGAFGSIVEQLNADGVPAPTGGKWSRNSLQAILTNEVYRGARVYNKRTFQRGSGYTKKRTNPPEEWVVTENAHPALVTPELWQRVQETMRGRGFSGNNGRGSRSVYLLSGLARCSECGGPISGRLRKAKKTEKRTYNCSNGWNQMTCVRTRGMDAEMIETAILRILRKILLDPAAYEAKIKEYIIKHRRQEERSAHKGPAFQKEKDRLERQLKRVADAISEVGISPTLAARLRELEAKKSIMERRISESERIVKVSSLDEIKAVLRDMLAHIDSDDPAEAKAWLQAIVSNLRIDISGKRASFDLKVPVSVSEEMHFALVAGACYGQKVQTRKRDFVCEVVHVERIYC